MIENNPSNVSSAFEMLSEEVEAEIDFVNGVGAKAFGSRDYDKAKEALERAGILTAFRDKVATLRAEWETLAAVAEQEEDEQTKAARRDLGRLRCGLRTPEAAYREPILRVLAEMGGSGRIGDVLERVGQIMKPVLKEVDYDPLASDPDLPAGATPPSGRGMRWSRRACSRPTRRAASGRSPTRAGQCCRSRGDGQACTTTHEQQQGTQQ